MALTATRCVTTAPTGYVWGECWHPSLNTLVDDAVRRPTICLERDLLRPPIGVYVVLETQSGPLRSVQKDEAWPKTRLCDAGLTLVGVLPRASCGFACWHSTSRRRALVEAKETSFLTLGARQIDPIPCAARGGQVCRSLGADKMKIGRIFSRRLTIIRTPCRY